MATFADLAKGALRKGGITFGPNTTPGPDEYTELIAEANRMLATWGIQELNIYNVSIDVYPLTSAVSYTIGPGGDFNAPRPAFIKNAVILLDGGPVRLSPMYVTADSKEWVNFSLQLVPGAIPLFLYNDGDYPLSNLYLWPQDDGSDSIELSTWTAIQSFTATTDTVVLPPGYEDAIVNNLALRVGALYPHQALITEDTRQQARDSLAAIQSRNAQLPKMTSDAAGIGRRSGGAGLLDWRSGLVNR